MEYQQWNKGAKPKRQNRAKACKGKRQIEKPKATSREAISQKAEPKGRSQKEKVQRRRIKVESQEDTFNEESRRQFSAAKSLKWELTVSNRNRKDPIR